MATSIELRSVFDRQGDGLARLRATDAEQRIAKLQRLKAAIHQHLPAVVAALNQDLGRPAFEAMFDIGSTLGEIDTVIAALPDWMAPVDVPPGPHAAPGSKAKIVYQPRGRVLVFGPWNFAFSLLFQPLVGAVAAGNAVVLKPSELAPATADVAAKIVADAFEPDEVALFQGGPDLAEALLELPFDHIFFTGSTAIGRTVMRAAAAHLATVTLELGGKCPAIVDDTVDIDKAAGRIVWGKFLNGGQVCLSPDHVWVHESRHDELVAALVEQVRKCYYPDGSFNSKESAHFVNQRHLGRVRGLVEDAVAGGAELVMGGTVDGLHLEPTIVTNVETDSSLMREEIFGPVLPVLKYTDKDRLIRQLNGPDKPLGLYLFSDDDAFVEEMIANTSSGGVTVNDVVQHATAPTLPFGGVGSSGIGAYHGEHSFRELSHARSVYYQADENPMEHFMRPPYDDRLPG